MKQLFLNRKLSPNIAAAASDAHSLRFIRRYFRLGFNYDEIIASLAFNHDIFISKRNLNRKLRKLDLYRRKHHTDIIDVACFIEGQLSTVPRGNCEVPSKWNSGKPRNSASSSWITRPRGGRAKAAAATTEEDIQRERTKLCMAPEFL